LSWPPGIVAGTQKGGDHDSCDEPADAIHPFTVTDLEGMPDDGRRYELIDGELLVCPAPGWARQEAVFTLYMFLRNACPPDLRVIGAPFAVRLTPADLVSGLRP
jgi:hypothetical protein